MSDPDHERIEAHRNNLDRFRRILAAQALSDLDQRFIRCCIEEEAAALEELQHRAK